MLVTDPVADLIIRIKNALLAQKAVVIMPHSKLKENMAKLLVDNNYISKVEKVDKKPQADLKLTLKYVGKTSAISGVKQVSKPGRRIYASADKMPRVLKGYGITIVSTNKGVMIDTEARKQHVGGEVLCQIW